MGNTYISVIIVAYNRKEFLLNAVKSVLNQSLDKKYYEIIVVKNFRDDIIDNFIEYNNITNIYSYDATLGGKLIEGIKISRGQVISFLEDDDEFTNDKLEYIVHIFNSFPDIMYYHNSYYVNVIKEETPNKYRYIKSDNKNFIKSFKKLSQAGSGFNLSCMNFRRECLVKNMNILDNTTFGVDSILLYIVYNSKARSIKDNKKLTLYRFHNSTSRNLNNYKDFSINNKNYLIEVLKERNDIYNKFNNELTRKIIGGDSAFFQLELGINSNQKCQNLIFNISYLFKYGSLKLITKILIVLLYFLSRLNNNIALQISYKHQNKYINKLGN